MINCDCTTCQPGWCAKIAIQRVRRNGKEINVCFNCAFSSDEHLNQRLFDEGDIPRIIEMSEREDRPFGAIFNLLGGIPATLNDMLEYSRYGN